MLVINDSKKELNIQQNIYDLSFVMLQCFQNVISKNSKLKKTE